MDIALNHEGFDGRGLLLRTASLLKGPRLVLDGTEVRKKGPAYLVQDNAGKEVSILVKPQLVDPVPRVEIDGKRVDVARPLRWYEYVWMALPVALFFGGGALGVLLGGGAAYANARIFRSNRSATSRYALTGLVSLGALVAFAIVASMLGNAVPADSPR